MQTDPMPDRIADIKQALLWTVEKQDIYLVYQGQNALSSQELVGIEALCRIKDGPWGGISPEQFIPVTEQMGLIPALERLVFAQLARDLPLLRKRYPGIRVGINLSIIHIAEPDFLTFIHGWLSMLPKATVECLDFEITETYLQRISKTVIDGLHVLRSYGVRIVMDDFGSGQSSLSRLHTLPFDVLKLDKQFVQQIDHPMVYAIVKAAVAFTKEFGLALIAEGVETAEQCQVLKALACDWVQGFYFSHPQPLSHWLSLKNARAT